jgi:DNA polymerase-3 subunit delta'
VGDLSENDACGKCPTCLRIARRQFSDVIELEKGDRASIGIEPLRDRIMGVIGYRPFEGERRVYIIDPADDLTWEAQAALLKTLEEPPPSAILILVTAYPDTLLPTVQSRCRRLRFGPLSEADVARVLSTRCDVEPARARVVAVASAGSVARALAVADDAGDVADDRDAALALVTAAAGGDAVTVRLKAAAGLAKHEKDRRGREAVSTRLALVSSLLRDMRVMLATAAGTAPAALANADLAGTLETLAPRFGAARLVDAFGAVDRAQSALERNASHKIVADWVALSL